MKERKKIKKKTKLAGFSVLEMLVAIFIFALIITVTISAFIASYKGQKRTKDVQKSMEGARGAIELMAKNIRMGTIDSGSGLANEIAFYNYSQEKCIKYKFNNSNDTIEVGEVNDSRVGSPDCSDTTDVSYTMNDLIADKVVEDLKFEAVESDYSNPSNIVVGRVTISIQVKNFGEPIQTTVSLRDYNE